MPRLRVPRPLAAALGLMLVVSCQNLVCGCPPAREEAVLYGRVTDPAGNPVAGAAVWAEHGPAGCQEAWGLGWTTSGADGRYRAILYSTGGPVECMRAFARPPTSSTTLRASDTATFQVRFAYPRAVDSVRVDLVLRPP
ncbi:MAG: carboxypeptidase-like regulatory domain-containing protein [Gemmatimonadetes bacterium]|nr:carboxypeptidase-like regulatory domain-containing protein [Gemmatimonadota bacterium]